MSSKELMTSPDTGLVLAIPSSKQIRKALPTVDLQYEYQRKIAAIRSYTKDPSYAIAELEAQVAIAETWPEALKRGDVRSEHKQGKYQVVNVTTPVSSRHVSLWKQLAAVPAKVRQAYYDEVGRPTRAGLLREWRRSSSTNDSRPQALPTGAYDVIYTDPPWRYDFSRSGTRQLRQQYSGTMSVEEICRMAVPAKKDCVLYLWATNPKLLEALAVIEGWGFVYKTNMVWVKDKIGMGYWARSKHELLLIATKGSPSVPTPKRRPESVIVAKRSSRHSAKPEAVYAMIETCHPKSSKVELFARGTREGWDSWGDEAESG